MSEGTTLVVGIGEVGRPLAEVLERSGPVLRHDLERREFSDPIKVMHICFPFRESSEFIGSALDYVRRFKPALTIVNSTVLPGTTRTLARQSQSAVCYSPVRGKHVEMVSALTHYVKFVAAPEEQWATAAENHFARAGLRTQRMGAPETLEVAKLAETTYFGVCIAFAQELNRYASMTGGNYGEITRFFEEVGFLPRQKYFPGFIGGHCVVPNINLLLQLAPAPLLEAVLDSNRRRAAELLKEKPDCDRPGFAHEGIIGRCG